MLDSMKLNQFGIIHRDLSQWMIGTNAQYMSRDGSLIGGPQRH